MNDGKTKIKICGLMRPEDISYVNAYRPEYAGFVFAKSRRQIDWECARRFRMNLCPEILATGVFVNEDPDYILKLCDSKIIDVVQLHGEENELYIEEIKKRIPNPVVKAVRVQSKEQILEAEKLPCDFLLLDTYSKGQYGGSGEEFDLSLIPQMQKPFFLAGGLSAENVKEKIRLCHPYAVDISSGVEDADGWKDHDRICEFIKRVREVK